MEVIKSTLLFLAAFGIGEIFAIPIFSFIRKKFSEKDKQTDRPSTSRLSIFKGILERFIILLGLAASLPTVLIFFGAVKLGTRLKDKQDSPISNDYFLIGNITSVAVGILEYLLYKELLEKI